MNIETVVRHRPSKVDKRRQDNLSYIIISAMPLIIVVFTSHIINIIKYLLLSENVP